ncbi:MAG TPA: TlpA disulfide reductase family protein [Ignavibacteriales bacterium]|nr:TlpA disulfide reductase family protein [Ignavibacteriales bacterium]
MKTMVSLPFFFKHRSSLKISILLFYWAPLCLAQTYHVELNRKVVLDDQGLLLEIVKKDSANKFISPDTKDSIKGTVSLEYFDLSGKFKLVNILVASNKDADMLYIDRKSTGDFSKAGPPLVFDKKQNRIPVVIYVDDSDSNRIAKFELIRCPVMPQSVIRRYILENGDLNPMFAKSAGGMKGVMNFEGKAGSFYFVDQNNLSRGEVIIDGKTYSIGLYDYQKNGIYNDSKDLLMINLHGGEELNLSDESCVFKLNDIFRIPPYNYRMKNCDKYGMWVDLEKTDENTTDYYIMDTLYTSGISRAFHKYQIDKAIWDSRLTTLSGEKIDLRQYKGKYLLLNFWGEWCGGCIQEIPELLSINEKYSPDKIKIISFIRMNNKEKALKMIKEKKMTWPQVELGKEFQEKFRIKGYPTNILILPDGVSCFISMIMNKENLEKIVK